MQFIKKKKFPNITSGFLEGRKCKRKFKNASKNDRNTLSLVKDIKTLKTLPSGLKASRTFIGGTEIPKGTPS